LSLNLTVPTLEALIMTTVYDSIGRQALLNCCSLTCLMRSRLIQSLAGSGLNRASHPRRLH
jgi:hypothetical protein